MRRAAQANWSRLPNHNPPRFYTAWTQSGQGADSYRMALETTNTSAGYSAMSIMWCRLPRPEPQTAKAKSLSLLADGVGHTFW
jgi:hypothetical protein